MFAARGLARIALTIAVVTFTRSAATAQSMFPELSVDALPTDIAVTPDGTKAVIWSTESGAGGGYSQGFRLIDVQTGLDIPLASSCSAGSLGQSGSAPSDLVQATNSRAIGISSTVTGAGPALDTTIIDVVDINANPAVCLAHHVRTGTGAQAFGEASDVAITPDGGLAVVNSRNWIHVIDLPTGAIKAEFNIGALPAGTCNPSAIADSVACTDERAIVTTTRLENNISKAWVYIVDLIQLNVKLEHKLVDLTANREHDPHDVAITRDGRFAVVTASKIVGLYDLYNASPIAQHPDEQITRTYRLNVDSVEVTNNRALVLGDRVRVQGGQTWTNWAVDVYEISATPTLPWVPVVSPSFTDPAFYLSQPSQNRAHDLAIAPEGDRALVRSEKDNLVVHGFDSTPTLAIATSPVGANPLAGPPAAYNPARSKVFTSDSVVIPPAVSEGSQFGLTIGSKALGTNPLRYVAYVEFVNIGIPTPTVVAFGPYESPIPTEDCVAADITLTRDRSRAVVRASAPIYDPPGTTDPSDILLFEINPPQLYGRFGATGNIFALDSVEVGRDRAISASEFLQQNLPAYPPPFFGWGWIQIVDL